VLDAPLEIDQGPGIGVWRPENYEGKFYGPSTLRFGIERSRNVMTVRLAQDIGMPLIADYAKRFGVYDDLPPYLSFSLGAGETTLLRMVTAYGMFDNGGRRIKPTLIDRIQDRYGHTVYKHDERECIGCDAKKWENQPEPSLVDRRQQVLDPMTAYQITSMMEGVVQRGTATVVRDVGRPVAGKTGTTNDEKDAWFIGFTPDIVVGVYMGYDKPRHIGRGATGGHLAADREGLPESALSESRRCLSACHRGSSSYVSMRRPESAQAPRPRGQLSRASSRALRRRRTATRSSEAAMAATLSGRGAPA
jgi:penicillin-binding protein 1A